MTSPTIISSLHAQIVGLSKRLCAIEAAELLRARGRSPRMPIEFCSQFGEDADAWVLLGRPLDGFFIEAGAFDGRAFSVTYALEAMGWTGLLVEGIPERAEACRRNRPNSYVVHGALVGDESVASVEFSVVSDPYGGMLSHGTTNDSHRADLKASGLGSSLVSVPAFTLNRLLADYTGPVDLAVIDVEGGELDVLSGFDLVKQRPRVLMLEDNSLGADEALTAYMARQPYHLVSWVEMNRVYVHKDEAEILRRVIFG